MKLTFLGTRGGIIPRSKLHYYHSSTLVQYYRKSIMLDCGTDWLKKVKKIKPDAIFISHAHPDHAEGLKQGSPCPVYATKDAWKTMNKYPIKEKHIVYSQKSIRLFGFTIEPFSVEHSIHEPAVGYRITAGTKTIFYVPDLVFIRNRKAALKNIDAYIGDGARITRPLIRKRDRRQFGHTSIAQQLEWCKEAHVPLAIFTHCGSEIVKAKSKEVDQKIEQLINKYGVPVIIAYDGMEMNI